MRVIQLKDTPIRRKLMVILFLTSLAVAVLMRGTFFAYEFVMFRQSALRQLSTIGEIVAANSTAALAFQDHKDATEILAALKAAQHIVAASLYDKNGKLFAKYPERLPIEALPTAPGNPGYRFERSHLSGFQPVLQGGKRLGALYLEFDTGTVMYQWFLVTASIGVVVIVIVLLVAYEISRSLQKQISEPILALADTARSISEQGDYSVRAAKLGRDELGLLTDAFNQMLAQIQTLNQELEQRVQERTAQLEAANKELEAFSYSVSHDLRAPLRHVDGFVDLLRQKAGGTLNDQCRRYLTIISDSARQMGHLIDDLLVFSRMGRVEMQQMTVHLPQLVQEVLQGFQPEIHCRRIVWKNGPLPSVRADPAMLRQVWANLIGNALKYTRPRDPAGIEIGCTNGTAAEWVLFVRDNGVGFDMRYVDKLFGVFQRLHRADEFEGTGIGLANVRRIIHRHGGRTWAEGKVNGGATFYFTLPQSTKR